MTPPVLAIPWPLRVTGALYPEGMETVVDWGYSPAFVCIQTPLGGAVDRSVFTIAPQSPPLVTRFPLAS